MHNRERILINITHRPKCSVLCDKAAVTRLKWKALHWVIMQWLTYRFLWRSAVKHAMVRYAEIYDYEIFTENYTTRVKWLRVHNAYLSDYPLLRLKELLIESPGGRRQSHFTLILTETWLPPKNIISSQLDPLVCSYLQHVEGEWNDMLLPAEIDSQPFFFFFFFFFILSMRQGI